MIDSKDEFTKAVRDHLTRTPYPEGHIDSFNGVRNEPTIGRTDLYLLDIVKSLRFLLLIEVVNWEQLSE